MIRSSPIAAAEHDQRFVVASAVDGPVTMHGQHSDSELYTVIGRWYSHVAPLSLDDARRTTARPVSAFYRCTASLAVTVASLVVSRLK